MEDYSVRIEVDGKPGSGLLYIPEIGEKVYIITAAHIFNVDQISYTVKIFFSGEALWDENGRERDKSIVECRIESEMVNEGENRVFFLPYFDRKVECSADDGAVIEIEHQPWMKNRGNIRFGVADTHEVLSGYGYPCNAEYMRNEMIGVVEKAINEKIESGEEGDYYLSFDPERYKGEFAINKIYLDGFSGTGLFVEKVGIRRFVGILSRSQEKIPRLFATDARKLEILINNLTPINGFPKTKAKIKTAEGEIVDRDLEEVLEEFLLDEERYIRCLHGYVGTGKTYSVKHLESICNKYSQKNFRVENSWKRLVYCLTSDELEQFKDTIYVFDCIENSWSKKDRIELCFSQISNGDQEIGYRRLNGREKEIFFDKIWRRGRELRENNIHILIIFRTNFLKDMCAYIKQNRPVRRWEQIEQTFIEIIGYSESQIEAIFDEQYPAYIKEDEMTRRPLWVKYIIERGLSSLEGKNQYEYEFDIVRNTIKWYIKQDGPDRDINYFEEDEEAELEKIRREFIGHILRHQGREPQKWEETLHPLIWSYPFKEDIRDGIVDAYEFDDIVLYAYFVAEKLYEIACERDELAFRENLAAAYQIGCKNNPLGNRIVAFLKLFFYINDDEGTWSILPNWLLQREYEDCRAWLAGNPNEEYSKINSIYNKNEYINEKQDGLRENYVAEKVASVTTQKTETINLEEIVDLNKTRRK